MLPPSHHSPVNALMGSGRADIDPGARGLDWSSSREPGPGLCGQALACMAQELATRWRGNFCAGNALDLPISASGSARKVACR